MDNYIEKSIKISDEFKNAFTEIEEITKSGMTPSDGWVSWAESMGYADKELLSFLSDVDSGKRSIQDIGTHIEQASKKTTSFGAGFKTTFKNIAGTIGSFALNMGASMLISAGIQAAISAIDNWIHASEIAIEKGKEVQEIKPSMNYIIY